MIAVLGAQMLARAVLVAALAAAPSPTPSPAPTDPPRHAAYVPDDENWHDVCATRDRLAPLDRLKCIPLGDDPNRYVTLGLDVRLKYEHFFNKTWDANANGYLLDRELLDVDVHDDRVRAFAQLEHANTSNPKPPIDPTWRDDLATSSVYLAYAFGGATGGPPPLTVSVGRMLLAYGSERMIDDRSGLNVEQPFDGVRARIASGGGWTTDVFVTRPVTTGPYAFDDLGDRTRSFSGIYATRTRGGSTLDLYGLVDQRQSQFAYRGAEPEVRDTIGLRYATASPTFDSDTEIDKQLGSFGGASIQAYAIETNFGFSFGRNRNRFRLGIGGGIASGDRDPHSSVFTLFRAPYPTGLTFGILEANGNENTSGFTPNITYTYARRWTIAVKDFFYYRQTLADGIYTTPGFPLRAPAGSDASPIGNLGYVSLVHPLDAHVVAYAAYARYLTGAFLQQSPQPDGAPSLPTAYYNVWLNVRL